MNKLYIFALLFTITLACNNYCNGHGKCGAKDKCECFMGWGGADCSLRSCPYDDAFSDIPLGDINHDGVVGDNDAKDEWRPNGGISENLKGYVTATRAHRYAECSNAGICNRDKGECECFEGYEGSACQRRSCPSSAEGKVCSGHGSCLTSTTIIHDSVTTGTAYYGWESEKYLSCLCDSGWEGIDCSMRTCPKGSDPVTATKSYPFSYTFSSDKIYDNTNVYYLKIVYDGIQYSTPSFSKADMKTTCGGTNDVDYKGAIEDSSKRSSYAEEIRRAVSTIPAFSKSNVEFVCPATTTSTTADIKITLGNSDYEAFSKASISVCVEGGVCATALQSSNLTRNPNSDINNDPKDKQYLCSRRGTCNSDTGECVCFTGYSGEACQNQRSIAL